MPIHDQGYRRYEGRRLAPGGAWWVIARTELLAAVRSRMFVGLLLLAWLPFVVRVVQIYFNSSVTLDVPLLSVTARTFRQFLDQQWFFVFLVTISMAGAIADDRRVNALQLYLSRPLTRVEYLVGKLVPALVYLLGVTLAPAMLLLVMQVALSGSLAFVVGNLYLVPAITLVCVVEALLWAFGILALSSISKSRRFVAVTYAGALIFTAAMSTMLSAITGSRAWAAISPGDMIDVLADAAFRVGGQPPVPVPVAIGVIGALIGLSIWILERQVRGVEVVR
jgi:ABC-2 type transport system permease protein